MPICSYLWYTLFILYHFSFVRRFLSMKCVFVYGEFIKYWSLCGAVGTVFNGVIIILFQGKHLSASVSFKCAVMYEHYFVHTGTVVCFLYSYSQLYWSLNIFLLIIRLLLSIKHVFLRWIYAIIITLCEFYQYAEVKIFPLNISWFIYKRFSLFYLFIYSLYLTFWSSEYKETVIHILHTCWCWRRGGRYICGVIPAHSEIDVIPGGGVPGKGSQTRKAAQNFMHRHWKSKVDILQEGPTPLPQLSNCPIHIPPDRMDNHKQTGRCDQAT